MESKVDRKVLVVDDQENVREAVKWILEEAGIQVVTAKNGEDAQTILESQTFDTVLSDILMGTIEAGGIQLLNFIKKGHPTPLILMTGFSHILEVQEAHQLGAFGFLPKPFKEGDLLKLIRASWTSTASTGIETNAKVDQRYCRFSIEDFISGKTIEFGIYLRLSEIKYVKIANHGEDIALDRIRKFKSKGVKYLYIEEDDFHSYLKMNLLIGKAVQEPVQISPKKKLALVKYTTDVLFDYLFSNEIDPEAFSNAKTVTENSILFLSDWQETHNLLTALNAHCEHLYAHSLGVSLYSVLIARQLGWSSHGTLFKLSIAGLLHDIGYKELTPSLYAKKRASLSVEEVTLFESHPTRGMEILSKIPLVPKDITQIVFHHHERDRGTGLPNHLHKTEIHPLARVIAVADEFCELTIKKQNNPGMAPKNAIAQLMSVKEYSLDPKYIEALAKVIKVSTPASGQKDPFQTSLSGDAQEYIP